MNVRLPLDPRIVANTLIDTAREFDLPVTHLKLQKIIYFLELEYLKTHKEPLVSGDFVAWQFGPVHPQIWESFKANGPKEIRHHAYSLDLVTGLSKNLPSLEHSGLKRFVVLKGASLLERSAPDLVSLSHVKGGPWDIVTRRNGGQRVYGSRISRELMLSITHSRPVAVGESGISGEILDEHPPA